MKRTDIPIPIQGAIGLTSAAFLYGIFGILSRIIGYNLPIFYQSWVRTLVASLILTISYKSWKSVDRKDWGLLILRSGIGVAAFLLFFIAVNAMEVNLTYFLFYGGSTLGGFVLGALVFKERTTPLRLLCLGLAAIGLAMVYGVSIAEVNPLYTLLAFISGICTASWSMLAKKITSYPPGQMAFLENSLAFPIVFLLSILFREAWPVMEFSVAQGTNIILGTLFAITGLLMVFGFRRIDMQIGSLIMLSEILFAVIFGFMIYQEVPSFWAALGGALIITSMVLQELNWKTMLTKRYALRRKTTGQ